MLDPVALKIYAICAVVLFVKMFAVGVLQGLTRSRLKAYTNPEDARLLAKTEPVATEHPEMVRLGNAYRNDLENIPMFLILGLVFLLVKASPTGAMYYFPLFTLARVGHTFFYVRSLQPWRTVCFGIGLLCALGVGANILMTVMK